MRLEFWGARGTAPVSGRDKVVFGGNTPCASVRSAAGDLLIIDAGTGIRDLGEALLREAGEEGFRVHLLLTHFHLDHIIGLPFFRPLFSAKAAITFYSTGPREEAEKRLAGLMEGRYFPANFEETDARKEFVQVPDAPFTIGTVRVSYCRLIHPQGSVAYKLEEGGRSLVFATDTENPGDSLDEQLAAFAAGATCLVYDATFSPEEYLAGKRGWGHSTWLEGTRLAAAAGVRSLILSHWNPGHSDRQIKGMIGLAKSKFPRTIGARQGLKKNI